MHINTGLKILAGAVALALSGGALANTTLQASAPGSSDVFLVIDDTTNGTGFVFDTGVLANAFNSTGSYTYNLTSLAGVSSIYNEFLAGRASSSDVLTYAVLGGYATSSTSVTDLYTASTAGSAITGAKVAGGVTQINTFSQAADTITNSGTTPLTSDSSSVAAFTGTGTSEWQGPYGNEPTFNSDMKVTDSATVGTALKFFTSSGNPNSSFGNNSAPTTYAYTWTLGTNGVLQYNPGGGSSVPLPAPVLLLLSGLGLMGVVARRKQVAA